MLALRHLAIFLLVAKFCHCRLHFVNDGLMRSPLIIEKYLESKEIHAREGNVSAVNFIDCTIAGTGHLICNKLLGTSFDSTLNCISMDVTPAIFSTFCSFDRLIGGKYNGAKVVEFCKALNPSTTCIILLNENLNETLKAYDQAFRILFNSDSIDPVIFLVEGSEESLTTESTILNYMINNDILGIGQEKRLQVIALNSKINANITINALKSAIGESKIEYNTLKKSLIDSWNQTTLRQTKPILSNAEKISMLTIESAYSAGLVYSEGVLSDWQNRIGSGRLVANFGNRADELFSEVLNRFRERTFGSLASRQRAEKIKMLSEYLQFIIESLQKQQLLIIQLATTASFKRALFKQLVSEVPSTKDKSQELLQKTLLDYQTKCQTLEVPSLNLSIKPSPEFTTSLETILTEFPESSIAKLEEVKKIAKQAKKQPKKNGRSFNVALSIVGMLKPPGYGNLQGFVSYITALGWLPVDFLIGFQNDGDSPEVIGDDREYPLLRLQPKFSFDIDL